MKRPSVLVLTSILVVLLSNLRVVADLYFDDGLLHNINYTVNDDVWVDYLAPGMQTTVNWLVGAISPDGVHLRAYEDSKVNFLGGW